MRKLFIVCTHEKVTYTIRNSVSWEKYWDRHKNQSNVISAILQQYPKKDNEPIILK